NRPEAKYARTKRPEHQNPRPGDASAHPIEKESAVLPSAAGHHRLPKPLVPFATFFIFFGCIRNWVVLGTNEKGTPRAMSPDPERIEALLLKFIHDDLSEQERIELEAYVSQAPWLKKLYDELQEDPFLTIDMHTFSRIPLQVPRIQDLGTRQRADHPENPAGTFRIKRGILAACAALFLLAVSAYLILHFYNGDVFENRTPRYGSTIA